MIQKNENLAKNFSFSRFSGFWVLWMHKCTTNDPLILKHQNDDQEEVVFGGSVTHLEHNAVFLANFDKSEDSRCLSSTTVLLLRCSTNFADHFLKKNM